MFRKASCPSIFSKDFSCFVFAVEFLVSDIPCNPQEQSRSVSERNPYCPAGCSMQMVCQYRNHTEDFCSMRKATNLRVDPPRPELENGITILNSTKCSLTVRFENMTADFQGRYNCLDDLNSGIFYPRNICVGGMYYLWLLFSMTWQATHSRGKMQKY